MKQLLIILILILPLFAESEGRFTPFVNKQLLLINKMDDANITQDDIMKIAKKQEGLYSKILSNVLSDKGEALQKSKLYDSEIFALEKVIKINKRYGNKYAIIRDEVLVKSYRLLNAQSRMVQDILEALDNETFKEFQTEMTNIFVANQEYNARLNTVDYEKILNIEDPSRTLKQAKNNIREYNALVEVNVDTLKYLSFFEEKMYRLNKYSKYNLTVPVLYINDTEIAKGINKILDPYGLTVVKLIIMFLILVFVYLARKFLYNRIEAYIYTIKPLQKYSKDILNTIRKPLEVLMVLIIVEIIVYIYHNYSGSGDADKFFNVGYVMLLTIIVYKVVNAIASVKIHEIDSVNKNIKNEVINVGIKILNFVIMTFGLLIVLHFAGANLTAVLSGLGIGGFAVALAAKDSLANFFGTLSILLSDVFSQGDWIAVNGKEGTVVEIGLRVTTLRTFDNAIIAIPNAILANQDVKNWDRRTLGRRIKMKLGVKYNSKYSDIQNAVEEIREMLAKHPQIVTENTEYSFSQERSAKLVSKDDEQGVKKTLLVYLDEFSDSSINILIYCFSKSIVWSEWLETKENVMYEIMKILEKHSLEFAFPSMSIYHENDPS